MVRGGDGALATQVTAHAPVLFEGGVIALDGSGIRAGGLVDVVGRVVAVDSPHRGQASAGVVVSVVLDDIVLDERIGCPSIDGEIAVAVRRESASEGNGPSRFLSARP